LVDEYGEEKTHSSHGSCFVSLKKARVEREADLENFVLCFIIRLLRMEAFPEIFHLIIFRWPNWR